MPIIHIVVTLVVIGFLLWVVNTLIPMQENVKKIINVFVVVLIVLWLVGMFFPGLGEWRPR